MAGQQRRRWTAIITISTLPPHHLMSVTSSLAHTNPNVNRTLNSTWRRPMGGPIFDQRTRARTKTRTVSTITTPLRTRLIPVLGPRSSENLQPSPHKRTMTIQATPMISTSSRLPTLASTCLITTSSLAQGFSCHTPVTSHHLRRMEKIQSRSKASNPVSIAIHPMRASKILFPRPRPGIISN